MHCRICSTPLTDVFIDLQTCPPANAMVKESKLTRAEKYFPLKLYTCPKCLLVQVDEMEMAEDIFDDEYTYFSSYSTSWLEHARGYTEMITGRLQLDSLHQVVEIASNDGYLLQYFRERRIPVLGIEPTGNTATVAREKGITTRSAFFTHALAEELRSEGITADLLIGNNVLAHVPQLNDFVSGMKTLLAPGGVITMEFPHLYQLVKHNQFDTIYHEHFSYFSFHTVQQLFARHGLEIADVEELPTHGGSLRIYAVHAGSGRLVKSERVPQLEQKEQEAGMHTLPYYHNFQQKADGIRDAFIQFLLEEKRLGKQVIGYGAAAKGNTLLNYCGVKGNDWISYVADASPHKQGKYLPGSRIPVKAPDEIRKTKPDIIIIFPWNLKDEIIRSLSYAREWGCRFAIPIPQLEIIA